MYHKRSLASAILVFLTALAQIAAMGCSSRASAGQSAKSESDAPKVVTVVIRDFKFEPAAVTVSQGDIVEWKNDDSVPHTATEDVKGKIPAFDSGNIRTGVAWRYVAQKKGTYDYICTLHPNMQGKLIVQ